MTGPTLASSMTRSGWVGEFWGLAFGFTKWAKGSLALGSVSAFSEVSCLTYSFE